jgi:hypothetical protein
MNYRNEMEFQLDFKFCKDGGSLSVCQILIRFQDFNCVARDNS